MPASPTAEETARLIETAIDLVGSQAKLGRATGRTQNAVWQAKSKGRVTAEFALAIDRATSGRVAKEALRPDIYFLSPAASQ